MKGSTFGNVVSLTYTNHRGETAERRIVPLQLRFGTSEHHREPQWLLEAYDLDKQAERTFTLNDVRVWDGEFVSDPPVPSADEKPLARLRSCKNSCT